MKDNHLDLIKSLTTDLNKKFKGTDNVAFVLDGSELAPADVTDWISTGSSILDLVISNRPYGGYPVGRIIELTGLEQSGKSLLAAHSLKSTQLKGGIAVYIDTENAFSREFATAIGIDLTKLIYIQLETIEDSFDAVESIIEKVRKADRNKLVTIVIDSIMGASTKTEIASEWDKDGYATAKAIVLSKAMRKITNYLGKEKVCLIVTNQLRIKLGVSFGDPYCVDPVTTKISIFNLWPERPNTIDHITIENFATIIGIDDLETPCEYDLSPFNYEITTLDDNNSPISVPILKLIVKEPVDHHYSDGKIKVSGNHRIVENGKEIFAKDHPDFVLVNEPIKIVDFEVGGNHTYLANGRVHHNTTSGGKAIGFHASVRLRLKVIGQIKHQDEIVGVSVKAQVIKNRVGPPLRTVEYDIYFASGIDDYGSWLKILKENKLVTQAGAWYTFPVVDVTTGEVLEEIKFQSKDFYNKLIIEKKLREYIYDRICEKMILQYKHNETGGIDDVEIDTDFIEDYA